MRLAEENIPQMLNLITAVFQHSGAEINHMRIIYTRHSTPYFEQAHQFRTIGYGSAKPVKITVEGLLFRTGKQQQRFVYRAETVRIGFDRNAVFGKIKLR